MQLNIQGVGGGVLDISLIEKPLDPKENKHCYETILNAPYVVDPEEPLDVSITLEATGYTLSTLVHPVLLTLGQPGLCALPFRAPPEEMYFYLHGVHIIDDDLLQRVKTDNIRNHLKDHKGKWAVGQVSVITTP